MATDPEPADPGDVQGELPRIALFESDSELLRHVVPEEAERARRTLTVPLVVLPAGEVDVEEMLSHGSRAFAGLVTAGLLTREVTFGGQPTLLLLGPGDLVHPTELDAGLLTGRDHWAASGPVRIALLDDRFLHAVRTWPRVLTGLMDRASERHDSTVVQLAISQQPRVEDRLVALFKHLAERWGRVTPEGVVVSLSLTHEALGRIIGARRPTVTLALKALAGEDRLHRRSDGSWVLHDGDLAEALPLAALKSNARPAVVVSPDGDLAEAPPLAALKSNGRPAVVVSPEPTEPLPHRTNPDDIVDELSRLRAVHGELRDRLVDLGERSEANCRHSQNLIHLGRVQRTNASPPAR